MELLTKDTARDVMVFMADSADHLTGKTGLTLTITASKNAGSFSSISPTVTEISSGWYKLALTSSHTDTLGDFVLHVTATGADPSDVKCQVLAVNLYDAVRGGMTALPNAAANANGGLPILSSSGTTLAYTVSTLTTYTGNTPQTGDAYAVVNSGTHGNAALKTLIDAVDDFVDTEVAAIKLKTDLIPSDPADASDIAARFDAVDAALVTIDNFIDTEVAAIKAVTDALPSFPANFADLAITASTGRVTAGTVVDKTGYALTSAYDPATTAAQAGDAMTLTGGTVTSIASAVDTAVGDNFTAVLSAIDAVDNFVDTEVAAIKARTDLIPDAPAAVGDPMTLEAGERTDVADAVLLRSFADIEAVAGPYTLAALIPASFLFTFTSTTFTTYRTDGTTLFNAYDLTSTAALGANVATSMGV